MDLEFPRGDTKVFKFKLTDKNGEELTLTSADKIYMTVKKDVNSNTVIFQKRIGNGIELKDDGYYYVRINPDDTNELSYGQYGDLGTFLNGRRLTQGSFAIKNIPSYEEIMTNGVGYYLADQPENYK